MYMIEYHTIFILKKTDRFFKTFRSPLPENSAGAADEAPLRSCGSPCIAPSWGDAKCFGGGKTHEIRILTQLCAGQRAKIWRRGKDFFGKSSLKNAHFCYNSSKVPLCGGGLLYCGPLFRPAPGPIGFNEERKMGETILELQNIAKHFGDTDVLNGISISIGKGEFITLLGPSGCGKTTTLRIIAGLETPDEGRVILNGQDVTDSEPNKRDVNTVFQNYALFPNMTVEQNVLTGLNSRGGRKAVSGKRRPLTQKEKDGKVREMLSRFRLEGLEKRYPAQLSGGQQQRVALARILAYEPEVLLLDEPFSAMDTYLREGLRLELAGVLKDYDGVSILVTHDRDEAYQLCDSLLLLDRGRVLAGGKTRDIFQCPVTCQAARLTGCKNISRIERLGARRIKALDWGGLELSTDRDVDGSITAVGIRAHDFEPLSDGEAGQWKGRENANLIQVESPNISEMPFEWYITLSNGLWWKKEKDIHTHNTAGLVPGWLRVEPSALLLLTGELNG